MDPDSRGSARGVPEPLRQLLGNKEARDLLIGAIEGLPGQPQAVRPVAPLPPRRRPVPSFVYFAAAALLLAAIGFSVWSAVTLQQERRRG